MIFQFADVFEKAVEDRKLLYSFEDYVLDSDRRELRRGTDFIALQPQVFDLLQYLIRNRDRVVSKDELIADIWGGRIVSESALGTRINAARTAIGDSGEAQRLIRTLPRRGVRFVGLVCERTAVVAAPSDTIVPKPELALPKRPSIAVLPFVNMSGDQEQEYFADGMVEEIITALSRIRWLFVIARNSTLTYKGEPFDLKRIGRELGVRYVLEGSVRKGRGRVRITAQLIEAESGAQLWADHFDGSLDDVFVLQDQVAISVAGVIEPTLQAAEGRHSACRPTDHLTAYDLYLRALATYYPITRQRAFDTLQLLRQAIAIDPDYGSALSWTAIVLMRLFREGWAADAEAAREEPAGAAAADRPG